MFQGKDALDQSGNASSAFKMADVWLDGADDYRIVDGSYRGQRLGNGLELSPISSLRPCAMTFDVSSLIEVEAGNLIERGDVFDLSLLAGEGNACSSLAAT